MRKRTKILLNVLKYEEIWEHKETALQWLQSEMEV